MVVSTPPKKIKQSSHMSAQKNCAWCRPTGWVIIRLPHLSAVDKYVFIFFWLAVTDNWSSLRPLTKTSRKNSLRQMPVSPHCVGVRVCKCACRSKDFRWIIQILCLQERIPRRDAWGQWRTLLTCGRTWKRPCPVYGGPRSATGRLMQMVPTQRLGQSQHCDMWHITLFKTLLFDSVR